MGIKGSKIRKNIRRKGALERLQKQLSQASASALTKRGQNLREYAEKQIEILKTRVV